MCFSNLFKAATYRNDIGQTEIIKIRGGGNVDWVPSQKQSRGTKNCLNPSRDLL